MRIFIIGAMLLSAGGLWAGTSSCGSGGSDTSCPDMDTTFSVFPSIGTGSDGFIGSGSAGPDIVLNGGFETGDLTSWTLANNANDAVCPVGLSFNGTTCITNSGGFAMSFGNGGAVASLSQILATTPGASYDLDFFLGNNNPNDINVTTFSVVWDGNTVYTVPSPQPSFPYTEVNVVVSATTNLTTLSFLARNDPGVWFLDDISASQTGIPEPAPMFTVGVGLLGVALLHRRLKSTRASAIS